MQKIIGTVQTLPQQIRGNIKPTIASSGEEYQKGFEDGKNSVVQIDRVVKSITFISLNALGKPEATLNLDNVTGLGNLFQTSSAEYTNTTVEHLTINCPNKIILMAQMLYCHSSAKDRALKHITLNVDTSKVTSFNLCFNNQVTLEIVDGTPLDLSSATNLSNMFGSCDSLVYVRFVENTISKSIAFPYSKVLSTDTIQSIIDGLADLTGQTSQTLTMHSTVSGKLTDEQLLQIASKNWIPQ